MPTTVTTPTSLLLVHSPVVGPSTWGRLAESARTTGTTVALPDLTAVIGGSGPLWRGFVETVVDSAKDLPAPVAVVGHSAAGALLPLIGDALGGHLGHLIFVDAVIPPVDRAHETPSRLKELLDQHTEDGVLAPWLDWWSDDVLDSLLPDWNDRAILRADLPALPRSYYDEEIPVPGRWSTWACRYLRLSAAYDTELVRAVESGWPTAELESTHLGMFTDPGPVLESLQKLTTSDHRE